MTTTEDRMEGVVKPLDKTQIWDRAHGRIVSEERCPECGGRMSYWDAKDVAKYGGVPSWGCDGCPRIWIDRNAFRDAEQEAQQKSVAYSDGGGCHHTSKLRPISGTWMEDEDGQVWHIRKNGMAHAYTYDHRHGKVV